MSDAEELVAKLTADRGEDSPSARHAAILLEAARGGGWPKHFGEVMELLGLDPSDREGTAEAMSALVPCTTWPGAFLDAHLAERQGDGGWRRLGPDEAAAAMNGGPGEATAIPTWEPSAGFVESLAARIR